MNMLLINPDRSPITLPCTCLWARRLGQHVGREVDRDCPIHAAEAAQVEAESGCVLAKPTGEDHGPVGIAIVGGTLEERRATVARFFPGWTIDECGVWTKTEQSNGVQT